MKFNFDLPFTIEFVGGFERVTNIIFCDYTRTVKIKQRGVEYRARIGYVGSDLSETKGKYLITSDRIYRFDEDDDTRDIFDVIITTSGIPSWLTY